MRLIKAGIDPNTKKDIFYASFNVQAVQKASAAPDNVTYLRKDSEEEADETEKGILEGYMSTFGNADTVGDIIRRGAFSKSLKERTPRVLWQHDPHNPIGVIKEAYEDNKGLFAVIELNLNIQQGREAYELYKQGAMGGFSIGALLEKYEIVSNEKTGRSYLDVKEVRLMEVSAVTFPANEKAVVTAIKSHAEELTEAVEQHDIDTLAKTETLDELVAAIVALKERAEEELNEFVADIAAEKAAEEEALAAFVADIIAEKDELSAFVSDLK